jgi:hypothetical protein
LVARFHVDTDFLVYALAIRGPERTRLRAIAATDAVLEISAIAWYEFCRGPRKRAPDITIAVSALNRGAVLLTRNVQDFDGVEGLRTEGPADDG